MKKIRYVAVAVILILAGAALVLFVVVRRDQRTYRQLTIQAQDISAMAKDYQAMQARVTSIENSAKGEKRGMSEVIGGLLSNLGIQSKLQSVKNIEQKNSFDLSRQDAELVINGLNMNEAVNLLYVVERGSYPLSLRSVEMSRTFESPDVFNLRLMISCFQKK